MGRPKKYVYEPGDVVGKGWVYIREGTGGAGQRKIRVLCPICKREVEHDHGTIRRVDRPEQGLMSCGCDIQRWRAEKFRVGTPLESCLRKLEKRYRSNASDRGHQFLLDPVVFSELVQSPCFYCGTSPYKAPFSQTVSTRHILLNGVDRVDSTLDYTPENTVACCHQCNIMKNTTLLGDFLKRCRLIASRFPESS